MPWFNPQGLILKTVGLPLRNMTNSTTNRSMVVRSHERRDKFKSANLFVHHRKQHSSFASSRVQATKIMNGFLSAEMSMNFTSGVEMTPGQSKVMSVLFVSSKSYSDLHTRKDFNEDRGNWLRQCKTWRKYRHCLY